ncbi:MAG TPA: hypothetical protein VFB95_04940 [Candidatus Cryosericum sp.]|nr:hypothetical protein [Candidatus Cryosericum sp.]
MSAMRAREHESDVDRDIAITVPLLTLRAGETLVVRIGAVDRQSGVAEVVARCRARDNRDLTTCGRWIAGGGERAPADHYYRVAVTVPERSPTVIWEVHQILLCDHDGNRRSYVAGKDFAPLLFQVLEREGVDCTPPRLLGIQLCKDGNSADE